MKSASSVAGAVTTVRTNGIFAYFSLNFIAIVVIQLGEKTSYKSFEFSDYVFQSVYRITRSGSDST